MGAIELWGYTLVAAAAGVSIAYALDWVLNRLGSKLPQSN